MPRLCAGAWPRTRSRVDVYRSECLSLCCSVGEDRGLKRVEYPYEPRHGYGSSDYFIAEMQERIIGHRRICTGVIVRQ